MWRLHAVHHSPHQLYWLNVGRFHPIEKSIQYAVDSLPFALLGAPQETLAAYFVFYAINGFFQHSNCRVRLGPLNYVVSGPELHRWHHSKVSAESNNNYGNNLILWDILFGTRWLPKGREVGPLGLHKSRVPAGLLRADADAVREGAGAMSGLGVQSVQDCAGADAGTSLPGHDAWPRAILEPRRKRRWGAF